MKRKREKNCIITIQRVEMEKSEKCKITIKSDEYKKGKYV